MTISIKQLNKTYSNKKTALSGINLELKSPSMVGLLGPNGAGKSTLMKLLVSELLPSDGELLIDGSPLKKAEKELKARLGYLPQAFGVFDELTVWQFLDYMAALKGLKSYKAAIESVIQKTNLQEKKKARIGTLSGGQRQRLGIAQALLGEPELLILDEPTVGLDPAERVQFRNLFAELSQDKIVLLSTHIIDDVQSICNRLVVIHEGMILFDGSPEGLITVAQGHVGVFRESGGKLGSATLTGETVNSVLTGSNYRVTSRINTAEGISCRIVAEALPDFAQLAEPSLEDAYLYLCAFGASGNRSVKNGKSESIISASVQSDNSERNEGL